MTADKGLRATMRAIASRVGVRADRSYVVQWKMDQLAAEGKENLMLNIVPRDSRPFDLAVGWTLAAAQSTTQI